MNKILEQSIHFRKGREEMNIEFFSNSALFHNFTESPALALKNIFFFSAIVQPSYTCPSHIFGILIWVDSQLILLIGSQIFSGMPFYGYCATCLDTPAVLLHNLCSTPNELSPNGASEKNMSHRHHNYSIYSRLC